MDKETELSVIIASLMNELGVSEYKITQETIDELKNDKKYIGINAYKENDSIIVKRTTKEDYKLEDLLEDFVSKLKELKDDK